MREGSSVLQEVGLNVFLCMFPKYCEAMWSTASPPPFTLTLCTFQIKSNQITPAMIYEGLECMACGRCALKIIFQLSCAGILEVK